MSQFTFNIADYRPSSIARFPRVNERGPVAGEAGGFVVLSSNSRHDECDNQRLEMRAAVVDIRSIREAHRTGHPACHGGAYPRRGKILRFTSEVRERVVTMAAPGSASLTDEDPDPGNCPTAA